MKSFYSCLDSSLSAPQPIQHMVIRDRAQKAGGAVVFYGGEENRTLATQPFVRLKLRRLRSSGIDGVIFYTLHQFRFGPAFDYALVREILAMGFEVHFAREGVVFTRYEDLERLFPFLLSVDYTIRRDHTSWWRSFVRAFELPAR